MGKFTVFNSKSHSINKLAKIGSRFRNVRFVNFKLCAEIENVQRENALIRSRSNQQKQKLEEQIELVEKLKSIISNWQSVYKEKCKNINEMQTKKELADIKNRSLKRQLGDLSSSSQEREKILRTKKRKLNEQRKQIIELQRNVKNRECDECFILKCEISIQQEILAEFISEQQQNQDTIAELQKDIWFQNFQVKDLFDETDCQTSTINGQNGYIKNLEHRVQTLEPALKKEELKVKNLEFEAKQKEANVQKENLAEPENAVVQKQKKLECLIEKCDQFQKFIDDMKSVSKFTGTVTQPIEKHLQELAAHLKNKFKTAQEFVESLDKMRSTFSSSPAASKPPELRLKLNDPSQFHEVSDCESDLDSSSHSSLVPEIFSGPSNRQMSSCGSNQLYDYYASSPMLDFPSFTVLYEDPSSLTQYDDMISSYTTI